MGCQFWNTIPNQRSGSLRRLGEGGDQTWQKTEINEGLGRGLGALIPAAEEEFMMENSKNRRILLLLKITKGSMLHIKYLFQRLKQVLNRRGKNFTDDKMEELTESIRRHGDAAAFGSAKKKGEIYELIAGNAGFELLEPRGLKRFLFSLVEADDDKAAELGLIENLQREDLSPLEEAMAFRRMMDEYHYTQESLSETLGKKP